MLISVFGTGLYLVQTEVDSFKSYLNFDFTFKLNFIDDQNAVIQVPNDLVNISKDFGINVPSEVETGEFLNRYLVDEINFGAAVSNTLVSYVNLFTDRYIKVPFYQLVSMAMIILLCYALLLKNKDESIYLYLIQFSLLLVLNFAFAYRFGILILIFTVLMFLASILDLVIEAVKFYNLRT